MLFLGVKLTEADDYRRRLAALDVTRLGIPAQRAFSRDLDAFVFVTYGGLDAFCNVVAAVAETHPPREIKFPLLASILAEDVPQPDRWTLFAGWLETLYRAPWYIEVRRLRNVINYGSVLAAPLNWTDGQGMSANTRRTGHRVARATASSGAWASGLCLGSARAGARSQNEPGVRAGRL